MESAIYCSTLTPKAPSGICVIRLAGPGAGRILERTFKRPGGGSLPPVDRAAYGLIWKEAEPIDEVLVIPRSSPPSESFEICCHSGAAVARALVGLFVSLGARPVPWSQLIPEGTLEYDLVRALLSAEGPAQALCLARLLDGSLRRLFEALVAALEDRTAPTGEAPNTLGDVPIAQRDALTAQRETLTAQRETLIALRGTFSIGRFLSTPPLVVVTGRPNAGKSTLFNAIVGEGRALTSRFAGTTRDPVETVFILNGFPLRLVDTAGCGASEKDPLILAGTRAARRVAAGGDLEIRLTPWGERHPSADRRDDDLLPVVSKCDLARGLDQPPQSESAPLHLSALEGRGIDQLLHAVSARLGLDRLAEFDGPLLVTATQRDFIDEAIDIAANKSTSPFPLDSLKKYVGSSDRSRREF